MAAAQSTRESILQFINTMGSVSGPGIAHELGITRQAVNLHLRQLLADRAIVKTGSTRAARYHPQGTAPGRRSFSREYRLAGLEESVVYQEVSAYLNFPQLPQNVEAILNYAFTEMLNNAVDHSKAEHCRVEVQADASQVCFEIRDRGIGLFQSIADKLKLEDEPAALIELVKGKTTTMPEVHSGEGIFFVSRAADRYLITSHRLNIEWNRLRDDVFVADQRFIAGTLVRFELSAHARTRLEDVFEEYAPAAYDFRFEKTRVAVKLLQSNYVSRSEAKRLLLNLDRFSEVELDMKDVQHVGQGFADEVFRVFVTAYPGTQVRALNASTAVRAMIAHASDRGT